MTPHLNPSILSSTCLCTFARHSDMCRVCRCPPPHPHPTRPPPHHCSAEESCDTHIHIHTYTHIYIYIYLFTYIDQWQQRRSVVSGQSVKRGLAVLVCANLTLLSLPPLSGTPPLVHACETHASTSRSKKAHIQPASTRHRPPRGTPSKPPPPPLHTHTHHTMPTPLSYAAYLREVAMEVNASIAPDAPVAAPSWQLSRSRHRQAFYDVTSGSSAHHTKDLCGDSYAYDYLQVPAMSTVSSAGAVQLYQDWRRQQQKQQRPAEADRPHSARAPAVHTRSTSYTASHLTASTTNQDRERDIDGDAMQRSFQRLYAVMQDEGRREGRGAAATERMAHASHYVLCSPQRRCRSRRGRSQRLRTRTASQSVTCCASTVIHVPSMDFDRDRIIIDDGDGDNHCASGTKVVQAAKGSVKAQKKSVKVLKTPRPTVGSTAGSVKVVSPALTSTDTSAITSSPSKLSTSSSRSCSQARQPRTQRHQCPNCGPRCDVSDYVGLPSQRDAHGRSPSSPAYGRWCSSTDGTTTNKNGTQAVLKSTAEDSLRLQWPGERRATPSRCPSSQPRSSPELQCCSTRRACHRSQQQSPTHGRHSCRHERRADRSCGTPRREKRPSSDAVAVVSFTRGRVNPLKNEAALRDIATRTCTCYWAEFPGLKMAVNPASHAADCPYQAHETLYAEVVLQSKADASSSSASASTSSHSRCSSCAPLHGRRDRSGRRSSSRSYRQEYRARAAPLRQALNDPEAKRTRGRAAVMGSTKRRTYMEMIMDAARDAPPSQPPRSCGRRSTTSATASSFKAHHDAMVTAVALSRPSSPTAQASLTTGEAPLKLEAEPKPQLLSHQPSSADDAAAATSDESVTAPHTAAGGKDAAPVVESQHGEAGRGSRGEKSPVLNDETHLRALSRPRCRPAVGVPGPGSYHVDLAYAASSAARGIRGAAIPKSARMSAVKSLTPGPGAYDVYRCEEERKAITAEVVAAGGAAATTIGNGDATNGKDTDATREHVIGKGVVFSSTGARQLQLRYGENYVHTSTWAKRAAAVPGPGAYNIVDGDRYDQSRPLGAAHAGHRFSKSADGAHFSVVAAASSLRTSLVLPWRDWAGGAYIGTATSDFVAHPSLAGGDRRTIGETVVADSITVSCSHASAAAAAAANAADGSVWKGVGSGVALRLTSQRFPVKPPGAPAAVMAAGYDLKTGRHRSAEGAIPPPGEPSPATYDLESALRWVQRRAPEISMTFRHDRGPRGPLHSTGGAANDTALASGVGGGAVPTALSSLSHLLSYEVSFSPGPGTYDVRSGEVWRMRRSPQWSFSTAARNAPSAAGEGIKGWSGQAPHPVGHPGPGTYDTEACHRALQRSAVSAPIGTAPRFTVDNNSHGCVHPSVTEAGVTDNGTRAGPGTYDVEGGYKVLHESIKGGVIPRAGADAWANADDDEAQHCGPGPGAYTLPALPPSGPTAYLGMSAPRFPYEQTLASNEADAGGRGAAGEDRCPSHLTTDLFLANLVTPGPGSYDIDAATSLVNRPGAIIGRAPRVSLLVPTAATSSNVGPGSYMLPALPAGRGAVMPTARARTISEASDAAEGPGPGLYNPVDMHASSTRTFSLARTSARFPDSGTHDANGPGPGAYEVVDLSPPGRSAVIGSAVARPDLDRKEGNGGSTDAAGSGAAVPGPGAYSPQYAQVEKRVPQVVLARAPAGQGAAEYYASSGASMLSHEQHAGADSGLGPGQYDPQFPSDLVHAGRGYTFGSAPRAAVGVASALEGPGPGAYEVRMTRDGCLVYGGDGSGAARFGTAPRLAEEGAAATMPAGPGPGAYTPEAYTDMGTVFGSRALSPAVHFGTAPRIVGIDDARVAAGMPGPGAYEPNPHVLYPTIPAISFPRADCTHAAGDMDIPGPGAYVTTEVAAARAAQFGSAPRFSESRADGVATHARNGTEDAASVPGPNAYAPNDAAIYPAPSAHRFGTAARLTSVIGEAAETNGVGPGAYDVEVGLAHSSQGPTAAAYSFPRAGGSDGSRGFLSVRDAVAGGVAESPGPGAYQLPPFFPEGPQWGFGTSARTAAADATEGSSPLATASPGPGAYATPVPAPLHGGSSFPKADTAPPTGDTASPGPGAYDVVDTAVRPSAPGVRFGTAVRHGCADVSAGNVDATAAGAHDDGVSWTPGPGAYSPNVNASSATRSTLAGPSFAQAPRMSPATVPGAAIKGDVGPGSYMIEAADTQVLPRAPAHIMAPPAPHAPRLQEPQPGPGSYEYPIAVQEHRRSALLLGRHGDSADIRRDTPGPGAYDADAAYTSTQVARQPGGFTMQGRPVASMQVGFAEGPGPGSYNPDVPSAPAAAAPRFGTAPRMLDTVKGDGGVGPGAYDLPAPPTLRPPVSFTQAPREVVMGSHEGHTDGLHNGDMRGDGVGGATPGPGSYDVGTAIDCTHMGRQGPSFTIPRGPRPLLRSGDPDASPLVGPGTYSPVDPTSHHHGGGGMGTNGPSAAFGLAERPVNAVKSGSDGPGPGTYDPHRPSLANGAGLGPSFGSAVRMENVAAAMLAPTPGPGAYAVASSFKATSAAGSAPAPSFGTSKRPSAVLNETPGPGSYVVDGYGTATSGVAMAPTFAQGDPRPHLACGGLDTPGPGAYYRASNFDSTSAAAGPSFGIGERGTAGAGMATPGPGTYYRDSAAAGVKECKGASFGLGERTSPVLNCYPGPGTYFRGAGLATDVAALLGPSFGTGERHNPKLNNNPGPGTYFRDTLPTATSAAQPRPRRPTAADTLQKLASVGYPTLPSKTKPATATTASGTAAALCE
ncbi:hypothetical protein, conserved [Leishmania tarentolae]|uniref:Uncharacterized protein n=1 Tax=Leishmania tarentolae TaxID=5689 RepID=A0A640K8A8_LEITA|nr:hypothetical protein, conserved [Leishmania tarentolae]